jgi:hypothetical protein
MRPLILTGSHAAISLVTGTQCQCSRRAQQPAMPVIGSPGSPEADTDRMNAVRRALVEIGYVEGQNVAVENVIKSQRLNKPARWRAGPLVTLAPREGASKSK